MEKQDRLIRTVQRSPEHIVTSYVRAVNAEFIAGKSSGELLTPAGERGKGFSCSSTSRLVPGNGVICFITFQ